MRAQRNGGLCGDDCAYRRLYEGSQASLADMASKQAGALNRVARLRSAIVENLKQKFPVEFGQAEAQLSRRLSTTDDEVLIAYLSGFLALPARSVATAPAGPPAGLGDLRDELEALGVTLPAGGDLSAWAGAVATYSQAAATANAQQAAAAAEPSTDKGKPKPRRRTGAGSLLEGAAAVGFDAGTGASAAATAPPGPPEVSSAPPAAAPDDVPVFDSTGADDVPWGEDEQGATGGLYDLFDGADYLEEPAPGDVPDPDQVEPPAGAPSDLDDLFDDGPDPLSSLFAEELSEDADVLVDALFSREAEGDPSAAAPPALVPASPEVAQPGPDPSSESAAATFPVPPTTPGLSASEQAVQQPLPTNDPTPAAAPVTVAAPGGRGSAGSVLRPELFPSAQLPKGKSSRRATRTSRVSAAPPDPRGLDVPMARGATGADLTSELFDKLVASVCIPRPVFISDLVAQVGSKDLVDAWEQRCRDMGVSSPVRFITPKARHRERGSLIVPHSPELRKAASEFTRSWWATCLDERRLRGAKLYEVAVLLHRFGESVITSRIEGDVVILRVNQARGLVGVVVALETDSSPGESLRTSVADAVGELLADRLTLVAILTYTSGGGTLEKLAAAVREEATARGWQPTAPVIASASWDFAADGGASALSVL